MERGPMALFGAIIAVGLGPAMWLGAQFGNAAGVPSRPPAVTVQQNSDTAGGEGGAAPQDPAEVIRPTPKSQVEPLVKATPKPRKSSARPSASVSPSPSPSESTATGSPSPSEQQSTAPTESTESPGGGDPPSDGDGTGTGGTGNGDGTGNGGGGDQGPPAGSGDELVTDLSSAV